MSDPHILEGEPASAEDCFLLDWANETWKQSIPRLGDALQRVVTLGTAMLGGSLFFVRDDVVPGGFRTLAMFLFLAAVAAAFHGQSAHTEAVRMNEPAAVVRFKSAVAEHRGYWLLRATWLLWCGLLVAVLGALAKIAGLA